MRRAYSLLVALGFAFFASGCVYAQSSATAGTITFNAQTVTANGAATPTLSWSTEPAASSCLAAGNWSGTKPATGNETLAAVQGSATYDITCTWPASQSGNNIAQLNWMPATANTDGSAYSDAKSQVVHAAMNLDNLNIPEAVRATLPPTATTVEIGPLQPGVWYFDIQSINARDVPSDPTNVISYTVPAARDGSVARASTGITINAQPNPPSNTTVEAAPAKRSKH